MAAEHDFWKWFVAHEEKLFRFEEDQEERFEMLSGALNAVHGDLTFEFGPTQDGKRELVLSAGGLKEAFPAVERVFASQPPLRRFKLIKFRPRRMPINDIAIGDVSIRSAEVFYKLAKDDDPAKIGVLLFLPGYDEQRRSVYGQIGYLFLDEALGEYDVETKVGFIDMMAHNSPHFAGAYPIADLASHFDEVIARN